MTMLSCDLVIIGGGPAGANAAIRARGLGLSVLIIDEGVAAGGQVYRAPARAVRAQLPKSDPGEKLRIRLAACGATTLFRTRLWHIEPDGTLVISGPNGIGHVRGKATLVATGAIERFHPFNGWTIPGVMGLAAATAMIKGHGVLPGRRVVVAGSGPLALLVASLVRKGGGKVAAVVDSRSRGGWLQAAPALVRRPRLALQGAGWMLGLRGAGTPTFHNAHIEQVGEITGGLEVTITEGRAGRRRVLMADAVCAGNGLEPSYHVSRLLGATMVYNDALGGWVPTLDEDGRTSVARLYAAGDGTGIKGAEAAGFSGEIAAIAAAVDLGRISSESARAMLADAHHKLAGVVHFGMAMARLMTPARSGWPPIAAETIVCRCEDITAGRLREAIGQGACSLGALKSATRCGMGPCGGRVCSQAALDLIEATGIERTRLVPSTPRSPLRPVPLGDIAGNFSYDDIPFPEPSPA